MNFNFTPFLLFMFKKQKWGEKTTPLLDLFIMKYISCINLISYII